ncbi:MAG: hypothetical protein QOJ02_4190 [Acidobacteriota bacterium]|jgi:hypothetical protein|nr:hypothetical protein [Acidobacteriota bacterium]
MNRKILVWSGILISVALAALLAAITYHPQDPPILVPLPPEISACKYDVAVSIKTDGTCKQACGDSYEAVKMVDFEHDHTGKLWFFCCPKGYSRPSIVTNPKTGELEGQCFLR